MALIPEVQDKWPCWPERFLLSPSSHKWQEDRNIWDPRVRWWLEIQGACSSHMQPLNWPVPGGLPWLHHPWEAGTVPINSSRREIPRMNDTSYVWKLLQSTKTFPSDYSPISLPHEVAWGGGGVGRSGTGKVLQVLHFTDEETKTARDQELGLNSHLLTHIYSLFTLFCCCWKLERAGAQ